MPSVFVTVKPQKVRYAITDPISLAGTIETVLDPTVTVRFSWKIFVEAQNPAYDPDKAQAAEEAGTRYDEPMKKFIDQTNYYQVDNSTRFFTGPDIPNMEVRATFPPTLQASTVYKFRLTTSISDGLLEGFSDATLETAGSPPSGTLTVIPVNGTFDTPRIMTAKDWVSSDQPISYEFGQMRDAAGQQVPLAFTAEPLIAVSTYTVDELPIGDPSTDRKSVV